MNPPTSHEPIHRRQFADQGFVSCRSLLTADETAELLTMLQPVIAGKMGHVGFGEVGNKDIKHGRQQQIRVSEDGPIPELAAHPYRRRSQQWAEYLTGYPLQFTYGQIIVKPPQYDARVQWHQDGYYWQGQQAGSAGISCWVALTDSYPENGAVGYVKGSNLTGVNPHEDAVGKYEFHRAFEVPEPDPETVVYARLAPGDAVCHHSLCIHGSAGNRTDQPRIGIVSHFFPVEKVEADHG